MKLTAAVTWMVRLAMFAAAAGGLAMSLLVFFSVVRRYVFASPVHFIDELVGLLFSACVFLTLPYVFAMGLNIRVTLLYDRLPPPARRVAGWASDLLCVAFFLIIGKLGYDFAATSLMLNARSDVARIHVGPWMALIPVSAFLTALIVLIKSALDARGLAMGTAAERRIGESAL